MLLVNCVIKGQFDKRNYRKMTISWSFSNNSFVKFHGQKLESHNMTTLYPNPCYNEVCYIGTALYRHCFAKYNVQ